MRRPRVLKDTLKGSTVPQGVCPDRRLRRLASFAGCTEGTSATVRRANSPFPKEMSADSSPRLTASHIGVRRKGMRLMVKHDSAPPPQLARALGEGTSPSSLVKLGGVRQL